MQKLIVMIGANSNIYKDFATKFSSEGYPILLISKKEDNLTDLNLPNCIYKSLDIIDNQTMEKAIKEAEKIYGHTDLLINCAGLMLVETLKALKNKSADDIANDIAKLLHDCDNTAFSAIQSVSFDMMNRASGTVINIGAIATKNSSANNSKFNLECYAEYEFSIREISNAFRKESGDDVKFVVISSGILDLIRMMLAKDVEENFIEEYFNEKIADRVSMSDIADIVSFVYKMPKNICIKEIGL